MGLFFFFNDTATTEIYTLSLHDALPIFTLATCGARRRRVPQGPSPRARACARGRGCEVRRVRSAKLGDRKSTRLNSSHANISYAVFCLKTRRQKPTRPRPHGRRPAEHTT